jgi:hypothetical protein
MLSAQELEESFESLRQANALITSVRALFLSGQYLSGVRYLNDAVARIDNQIRILEKMIDDRYYRLTIGSAGRLVSSRFASEQEDALAMAEHLKAKLSKGYEAV